jgi:hypothetical protein
MFQQVKAAVVQHTNNFTAQKKYRPPYWQLVKMANTEAEGFFSKSVLIFDKEKK